MSKNDLSKQAQNSLALYEGQDPSKISQLLKIQRDSIVNELMKYTGASDINDLAMRLSLHKFL